MELIRIRPGLEIPLSELRFDFARSGGPGGQNVNKLATKVELFFDVRHSRSLTEAQRDTLLTLLAGRIGKDGVLRLSAQESRSQWRNRERVVEKFSTLLGRALAARKKRVSTKPSAAARERRFREKKRRGETKKGRSRFTAED